MSNYTIIEDAELTNRLLGAPYVDYHKANEGESFDFEMSALIRNDDGTVKRITWIFSAVKGDEPELDQYDYDIGNAESIVDAEAP